MARVRELDMEMSSAKFKEVFDAILAVCDEARFHFRESGLGVRLVDTANVCMVVASFDHQYFEKYDYKNQGDLLEVGFDLNQVKKFQKLASATLPVRLAIESETKVKSEEKGMTETEYYITLSSGTRRSLTSKALDVNCIMKDPRPPNIELPYHFRATGQDFYSAVCDCTAFSDKVYIRWKGHGFDEIDLIAEGDPDIVKCTMPVTLLQALETKQVYSIYSIDYLKDIVKICKRYPELELRFQHDHPLEIRITNIDGRDTSYLHFLLAPRVETEDVGYIPGEKPGCNDQCETCTCTEG